MSQNRPRAVTVALLCFAVLFAFAAANAQNTKDKSNGRLLFGKVLDPQDNPVPDAVVYVTNTRTRAVRTYIVSQDGSYRFPSLSAAIDYEVYAQYKGTKSDTKSLSQFDDRSQVYMVLKVQTK